MDGTQKTIVNKKAVNKPLLVALILGSSLVFAAPARPGGGHGVGVGVQNDLQTAYQALRATVNGNTHMLQRSLQQLTWSARNSYSNEKATLLKMVRQSKKALNTPLLNPVEKQEVIVANLSTAINILIREKNVPGDVKAQLQKVIRHLRVAKLTNIGGADSTTVSELVKAKFFAKKFQRAPAIKKAIKLINQAKRSVKQDKWNNGLGSNASGLIQKAIQTIRNSYVFQYGDFKDGFEF